MNKYVRYSFDRKTAFISVFDLKVFCFEKNIKYLAGCLMLSCFLDDYDFLEKTKDGVFIFKKID